MWCQCLSVYLLLEFAHFMLYTSIDGKIHPFGRIWCVAVLLLGKQIFSVASLLCINAARLFMKSESKKCEIAFGQMSRCTHIFFLLCKRNANAILCTGVSRLYYFSASHILSILMSFSNPKYYHITSCIRVGHRVTYKYMFTYTLIHIQIHNCIRYPKSGYEHHHLSFTRFLRRFLTVLSETHTLTFYFILHNTHYCHLL